MRLAARLFGDKLYGAEIVVILATSIVDCLIILINIVGGEIVGIWEGG